MDAKLTFFAFVLILTFPVWFPVALLSFVIHWIVSGWMMGWKFAEWLLD